MPQPNVVFMLIDDMGWMDLSCYGSSFYETPHLDRLRSEGMMFTDAYAACPVCSPTRASILTGRYPARVGVTNYIGGHARGKLVDAPYIDHLPLEEHTLASALRDGGYRTYHVGKWHLGGEPFWPAEQGFDINIAGCDWGHPRNGYFSPYGIPTMEDGPRGEYLTDRLTDEAIRLMRAAGNTPFFLYLPYYAVHTPIQAPAADIACFEDKARRMGLDKVQAFAVDGPFPSYHKKHLRITRRLVQSDAAYAAMMKNLDRNIGRLLAALEQMGKAGHTLVIFTSDNGGLSTSEGSPTCNAPLSEGKGWMYEGGTRECLLVRWPGHVAGGSTCSVPVTSPDFYPTILEAAGLPLIPGQHCDGLSLVPLLEGRGDLDREAVYWHYPHYGNQGCTPGSSVRSGDWKLIEFFEDGRLELYNLREDMGEANDLAAKEPARVRKLHGLLTRWREEIEAVVPEPNPDYNPADWELDPTD